MREQTKPDPHPPAKEEVAKVFVSAWKEAVAGRVLLVSDQGERTR